MASIDNQTAPEKDANVLTMNEALDARANDILPENFTLKDSFDNILNADEETINGMAGYTLTDESGDLGELSREEAVLVQGAMNADDYQFDIADEDEDNGDSDNGDDSDDGALTLEEALDADNGEGLPDNYTLASGEIELGAVSVDAAEDALGDLADIVDDAENADELTLSPSFTLKDTLDSVLDADDDVLESMESYELTNEQADLGELSGEEAAVVTGAANAADYSFSREIEVEADEEDDIQVSASAGDDTFEFDDVDDIRDLEDDDDEDEDDEDDEAGSIVIDGFGEDGNDTLQFSADDLNELVEDATDSDVDAFTEGGQLTGDQLYVAADATSAQTDQAAFIFNTDTGALSFDADGAGGHEAVDFATLNGVNDLSTEDFNIA